MATTKSATKKTAAKTSSAKQATGTEADGKKASATKASPKKPAAKLATKNAAAEKAPTKKPAAKTAGKKASAKKSSHSGSEDNYTKPDLREHIKEEVMAGDKGGKPGQWSARKAQLVAHEYVAEGGGYKHPRNESQEHLKEWGDEKWHTADGKPAIRDDGKGHEETHRYLPDEAWKELSPEEKKATDEKKVKGSRKGKQYVANTEKASKARHEAAEHSAKKPKTKASKASKSNAE